MCLPTGGLTELIGAGDVQYKDVKGKCRRLGGQHVRRWLGEACC